MTPDMKQTNKAVSPRLSIRYSWSSAASAEPVSASNTAALSHLDDKHLHLSPEPLRHPPHLSDPSVPLHPTPIFLDNPVSPSMLDRRAKPGPSLAHPAQRIWSMTYHRQ